MAYVGNCGRHGQYLNQCDGCIEERPLYALVERIKGGVEPDLALQQILDEKLEKEQKAEQERVRKELDKQFKSLARSRAISEFLSTRPDLADDGVVY
jgi:hypothetical protein